MRKDLKEHFQALGLNPGASPAEIRLAYRRLIQRWHPDHFKSGSLMQTTAEDLTKEINEAYEQLYKKQHYKKFLPKAGATSVRRHPPGPRPRTQSAPTTATARPVPPRPREPSRWSRPWPWGRIVVGLAALLGLFATWQSLPTPRPGFSSPAKARSGSAVRSESSMVRNLGPVHPIGSSRLDLPAAPLAATAAPPSATVAVPARPAMAARSADQPLVLAGVSPPAADWDRLFRNASTLLSTFEVGDLRARVLAVQGAPDEAGEKVLRYGSSVVFLNQGRVTGWADRSPRLRVRSLPTLDHDLLATFAVGASRSEVDQLQGRPGDRLFDAYLYGSSVVFFAGDRVSRWTEGDTPLRTPLIPPWPRFGLDDLRPR